MAETLSNVKQLEHEAEIADRDDLSSEDLEAEIRGLDIPGLNEVERTRRTGTGHNSSISARQPPHDVTSHI